MVQLVNDSMDRLGMIARFLRSLKMKVTIINNPIGILKAWMLQQLKKCGWNVCLFLKMVSNLNTIKYLMAWRVCSCCSGRSNGTKQTYTTSGISRLHQYSMNFGLTKTPNFYSIQQTMLLGRMMCKLEECEYLQVSKFTLTGKKVNLYLVLLLSTSIGKNKYWIMMLFLIGIRIKEYH